MEQEVDGSVFNWLPGRGQHHSSDGVSNDAASSDLISNNGDVLVEAAIAGAGIALQPTFISSSAIKAGKLRVILPEHEPEPMSLYAVYAHRQLLASKVRCFVDFLDGYFGAPPYWDRFD